MTQKEIAARHNIGQPYLNQLLTGARRSTGISLGTFDRMFPRAVVELEPGGRPPSVSVSGSGNAFTAATIGGNATVHAAPDSPGAVESYRGRLALALASLKIPPECLAAVMQCLAAVK